MFTAPGWCVPCQRFERHWKMVQEKFQPANLVYATVDFGPNYEDVASHWATKSFNIMTVPSVLYFADDETEPVEIKSRAAIPFIQELGGLL